MTQYSPAKYSYDVDINRIMTHPDRDFARLPVDVGQTGLTLGRTFRVAREIFLTAGQSLWWKFSTPVPFSLQEQFFTGDDGFFIFKAWASSNVTVSGAFTTPVFMVGNNRGPERPEPFYTQQSQMLAGGSATPINVDQYLDVARVRASGATAQKSTVGGGFSVERLLPAGDYYLQFADQGNGSAGCYYLTVEERP